ncbi:isocitrate lyase/PEP mutase family protein [Mycolicibacterium lutetiense]
MPEPRQSLVAMIADRQVVAGGVYDCLSAALVQSAGFPALALSGAGVAAAAAGVPDLGLLSFGELLHAARAVAASAAVPLVVDADTGFGNELNVHRTCEQLVAAGAGAIVIEDQVAPKRCGHLAGKDVIAAEDFSAKIRAARRVLAGTDVALVARTDALAVHGLDDATERCLRVLECGADVTFVEAPTDLSIIESVAAKVPGNKMFNLAAGGKTPTVDFGDLAELGYNLVIIPGLSLMPVVRGIRDAARSVWSERSERPLLSYGVAPRDIFESVGLSVWLAREAEYSKSR